MSCQLKNQLGNFHFLKTLTTTVIVGITISVFNIMPSVAQIKLAQDHSQMHHHNGQDLEQMHKMLTQMGENMKNMTPEQKQNMKNHYEGMIKEMQEMVNQMQQAVKTIEK